MWIFSVINLSTRFEKLTNEKASGSQSDDNPSQGNTESDQPIEQEQPSPDNNEENK